jgi:hypothetical protein
MTVSDLLKKLTLYDENLEVLVRCTWEGDIVILCSMLFGYVAAETWHRIETRKYQRRCRHADLVTEFIDKQIWQFLTLGEWLEGNAAKHRAIFDDHPPPD